MKLADLGERICILGPSNSGKSTLAAAIGAARNLPVVHLDHYRHHPATNWLERPDAEFAELHDRAVSGDRWVIEGNYSRWLSTRLDRATGLVLLDTSTPASLVRYLHRTWRRAERAGGLKGVRDRVSIKMIRHILGPTRGNRNKYRSIFDEFDRRKVMLPNRAALKRFYQAESLTVPVRGRARGVRTTSSGRG